MGTRCERPRPIWSHSPGRSPASTSSSRTRTTSSVATQTAHERSWCAISATAPVTNAPPKHTIRTPATGPIVGRVPGWTKRFATKTTSPTRNSPADARPSFVEAARGSGSRWTTRHLASLPPSARKPAGRAHPWLPAGLQWPSGASDGSSPPVCCAARLRSRVSVVGGRPLGRSLLAKSQKSESTHGSACRNRGQRVPPPPSTTEHLGCRMGADGGYGGSSGGSPWGGSPANQERTAGSRIPARLRAASPHVNVQTWRTAPGRPSVRCTHSARPSTP